jgi:hypothetical protein
MDRVVKAALRREFGAGEAWGWRRSRAERGIFWDNRHKRLTGLTKRQILIALMWANYYAWEVGGGKMRLYFDEKRLWEKHFEKEVNDRKEVAIWRRKRRKSKW